MKDYLIILTGLPRGGLQSWKTLDKFVIKELNADLALCTENDLDKDSFIYNLADYLWLFDKRDNWEEYYIENYSSNALKVFEKGKGAGLWESGIIHMALKDLILKNYLNEIKKYKYFIYSRFDQFYTDKHPVFNGENIWIPKGEDYFGINDRHAVVNSKYTENFLNICNFIDSLDPESLSNKYLNCETMFKMHLENSNLFDKVKRIERFQFTSAVKNDFTRWRVPQYNLLINRRLKIKYPDEFIDSVKNIKSLRKKLLSFVGIDLWITYLYFHLRIKIGKQKNKLKNYQSFEPSG